MAYLKIKTRIPCDYSSCPRHATRELYNKVNSQVGSYCASHAQLALKQQQRHEDEKSRVVQAEREEKETM